jgi:hypothetical protein
MSTYMYAAHFARHTTLFFRFSHIQSPDIHGFILYLPYLNYPEFCEEVKCGTYCILLGAFCIVLTIRCSVSLILRFVEKVMPLASFVAFVQCQGESIEHSEMTRPPLFYLGVYPSLL